MSSEKKAAVTKYHRRALMTAADRLLTQFGYDGMNMNMLAKEAGYSKATVYVYFRSKDEIVRALSLERLALVRAEIALVLKSDIDIDEKWGELRAIIKEFADEDSTYFDFICTHVRADDMTDDSRDGEEKQLAELVNDILSDVGAIAPIETVKKKWYSLYGEIKTRKMFD